MTASDQNESTTTNEKQASMPVIIDLTVPWHISECLLRYALSGVDRYEQDVLGLEEADEEMLFQALARTIRAIHKKPIDEDDDILVRIAFPQDLTVEELLLAEQAISYVANFIDQEEAEAAAQVVQKLLAAYRWEIGKGPAPDPVLSAYRFADLFGTQQVKEYLLSYWQNGRWQKQISAEELAKQAVLHFGIVPESNLFLVMAREAICSSPQGQPTRNQVRRDLAIQLEDFLQRLNKARRDHEEYVDYLSDPIGSNWIAEQQAIIEQVRAETAVLEAAITAYEQGIQRLYSLVWNEL